MTGPVGAIVLENPLTGVNNFTDLLTNIFNAAAGIIGVLGTLMIAISGFIFMTSAGSLEKVTKAKTAFLYAIIGMLIALLSSGIAATIKSVMMP
ncbi:MAG: hypothetical protein AABX45_00490 [Nanoarchaeota archaeon]